MDSRYDIFLSYSNLDRIWVEYLARNLKRQNYSVFLDLWEIAPGNVWVEAVQEALRASTRSVLVATVNAVEESWVRTQYEALRKRSVEERDFRFVPVVFGKIPNLPFLDIVRCVDFRDPSCEAYRRAFHELLCGLEGRGPGGGTFDGNLDIPPPLPPAVKSVGDGGRGFLDEIFNTLESNPLLMILAQAYRTQATFIDAILDRAFQRYGESCTLRIVPPYSRSAEIDQYFGELGRQCGFADIRDAIDWQGALAELSGESRRLFLLVSGFENSSELGRSELAGALRSLVEQQYPSRLRVLLCGGEGLAELKYRDEHRSLLNAAEVLFWPEPTVDDVVAWQECDFPGEVIEEVEAYNLLKICGGHPRLVRHLLQCRQRHPEISAADYRQALWNYSFIREIFLPYCDDVEAKEKICTWLARDDPGDVEPWLQDPLLRRLYWSNVLVRRGRRLCWRCDVLRAVGQQMLGCRSSIPFHANDEPTTRCHHLAESLAVHPDGPRKDDFYLWTFPLGLEFPLNLLEMLVYFPPADQSAEDVAKILLEHDETTDQVTLVLSSNPRTQKDLHHRASSPGNFWVAPLPSELTCLLCASQPLDVLAELIASQVSLTRVSPYQTSRGVEKRSAFFGRRDLLAYILNRSPANYLVVGGRQMGKSSLLKEIDRHYRGHSQLLCHYLVLSSGSDYSTDELSQRLARAVHLPSRTDLDAVLDRLSDDVPGGGRRLVLIDEADAFVRAERAGGYGVLGRLRSLSEESRCHFVLAGFWDLYAVAVLDYQSPLKNFGEALTVGALEEDACRQLATEPMHTMGLGYEDDVLVERIVEQTGQRANLIAIVCHEMLKELDPRSRTLRAADVEQALASVAVDRALEGWKNLGDEDESRLDRIVVYATLEDGELTQDGVLARLDEIGRSVEPERLQRSLDRLDLAFVLRREGARYVYQVPLFCERILAKRPGELLRRELRA